MMTLALRLLALSLAALACSAGQPGGDPAAGAQLTTALDASVAVSATGDAPTAPACAPGPGALCWVNPLPQGSPLAGLWAARSDDAWSVGPIGALLHWDGRALSTVGVPTTAPLRAVWGSAADDVWAVGDAVLHYDGRAWSAVAAPAGSWNAVHGAGPADVWMVGAGGAAARFDGTRWSRVATPVADDLSAVAVVSPSEVHLALARGGMVLRFDGTAFTVSAQLAASALWALFAPGPGELWAAGEPRDVNAAAGVRGTALAHLQGGAWTDVTIPGLETASFFALDGTAGELWVAGATSGGAGRVAHLDAAGWQVETAAPLPLRAVRATAGGALASGDGGELLVRAASGWTPASSGVGVGGYLQAAAFSPQGDGWFAAVAPDQAAPNPQAALLRLSGSGVEAVPLGVADVVYGVWANADDDVWAGSLANGLLHFDGKVWTARVGGYAGRVEGLWATGPSDVWGAAGDVVVHFDGATVTPLPLPGSGARRVFGVSARDLWAVGAANQAFHYDGTRWSSVAIPGLALAGWGRASDDVWLVGEAGLALHWDGRSFSTVATGTTATLWAAAGTAAGEVWVAGAQGTALRFTGGAFQPVATGTRNTLAAIAVSPAGDVYLAGEFGTILRSPR